jgi:hypothetical protein
MCPCVGVLWIGTCKKKYGIVVNICKYSCMHIYKELNGIVDGSSK